MADYGKWYRFLSSRARLPRISVSFLLFLLLLLFSSYFIKIRASDRYRSLRETILRKALVVQAQMETDIREKEDSVVRFAFYMDLISAGSEMEKGQFSPPPPSAFDQLREEIPDAVVSVVGISKTDLVYPTGKAPEISLWWERLPVGTRVKIFIEDHRKGKALFHGPYKFPDGRIRFLIATILGIPESKEADIATHRLLLVALSPEVFHRELLSSDPEVTYALRADSPTGKKDFILSGNPEIFSKQAITLPITLPVQRTWLLSAIPAKGWLLATTPGLTEWILAVGFSLGLALLFYLFLESHWRARLYSLVDPLTGLGNRRMLMGVVGQVFESKKQARSAYFLYLDLDRFKEINDEFGHKMGDKTLILTAQRLKACTRLSDIVVRVGGDEFCLLISRIEDRENVIVLVERIIEALQRPMELAPEVTVTVGVSVGISVFPRDGTTSNDLMMKADRAMYKAKHELGGETFMFYRE